MVLGRRQHAGRAAQDHHLARPVARGLEQDGVHGRLGLDPRGEGLDPLGVADLDPSAVTAALSAMFWALNGATFTPWRASSRHSPATTNDLPASLVVPHTRRTAPPPTPP